LSEDWSKKIRSDNREVENHGKIWIDRPMSVYRERLLKLALEDTKCDGRIAQN